MRIEILGRLLELNHERYAAEVAAGLRESKKGSRKKQPGLPRPSGTPCSEASTRVGKPPRRGLAIAPGCARR
ncbi:hypothetical protein RIF23_19290 [Lipingzhangella sp. LS1_29]|uniref:Transposase n=1 Tax=Lipingzhangella rawalii TaxID=2055835 RepID=A0ABU2HAT7_9ACTN|nr:hypothetical protein [Lipingzhangella rawalii]MDS1272437.1 hypothetical protein [Lipingzhangella rawalii]